MRVMAFIFARNTDSGADFTMKSSPPASIAVTSVSGDDDAVRNTMGVHAQSRVASIARMRADASKPFMTGIWTSIRIRSGIRSGGSVANIATAISPFAATLTS